MTTLQVFLLLSFLLTSAVAAKLLNYIIPCKRRDPKFTECLALGSILPVPNYVQGDSKIGIPVLDPLSIDYMSITQGTSQVGLRLDKKNALLHGNANNKILGARADLERRFMEWDVYNEEGYVFEGDYTATGRVLVLPITGHGRANMKFWKMSTKFAIKYDLVMRDGKEYMHVTNTTGKSIIREAWFHLDNLFNGDKLLGDNMNQVLNDNAKELARDLEPSIVKALVELYQRILNEKILPRVTFNEIFPE